MTGQSDCRGYPLGRVGRVLLATGSLCLLGGFAVALFVVPDPRGFGTHEQLGLSPCRFKTMFDIPCPSCGMTTSFSNFIRGRFITSAEANPAGFLLAAVCAVGIPWCWLSVWTGRFWRMSSPDAWLMGILFALCCVSVLQWMVRLALSN